MIWDTIIIVAVMATAVGASGAGFLMAGISAIRALQDQAEQSAHAGFSSIVALIISLALAFTAGAIL